MAHGEEHTAYERAARNDAVQRSLGGGRSLREAERAESRQAGGTGTRREDSPADWWNVPNGNERI